MEPYSTEEEQVEALRRWWQENGRSTIAAVVIALAAGFGWQSWKQYDLNQQQGASDTYQLLLQELGEGEMSAQKKEIVMTLGERLKTDYSASTYAQFAALHLAKIAIGSDDLAQAEQHLRWVLGKAGKSSDTALVAQLRLARVTAAAGDTGQALDILAEVGEGPYQAAYAIARGDILLSLGRDEEARVAYQIALAGAADAAGQVNLATLQQKLQSLSPVPARELDEAVQAAAVEITADVSADRQED